MSEAAVFLDLVDQVAASGRISSEDVLALRRQVFPDGVVSAVEADAVFRLDHACPEKCAEWTRFYIDALTDYYVWQSSPRGYVSEEQACDLLAKVLHDGRIDAMSELELLLNVMHWCESCPEALGLAALAAVKESVLTPGTAAYGSNRPRAVVSPADVALIHKVIHAPGSPGGFTVTRGEADLLFDLDRATRGEKNAPAWPDLFAKAVANALMFPRGAPAVPSAEEALRRERWLEERDSIGGLLASIGKEAARGDVPLGEALKEADIFGAERVREAKEKEDAQLSEALHRESIDAEEAHWLIGHLEREEDLSVGELKLLAFIKANSPAIDPALDPYFEKAGL
jgi:hypothetical protein